MEKLDFAELRKEKLGLIFENIDVLSAMKESDTQLPPEFFKDVTDGVIRDYSDKMSVLNRNTRFVIKELKKDFRLLRRIQRKRQAALRKQRKKAAKRNAPPTA
ncbi:MAG: hypothetical protein LBL66_00590 [Clostridiales bacterium]|jgi:hypothetical protein|nr:hypothetical protein [Clostridiales bacterium]